MRTHVEVAKRRQSGDSKLKPVEDIADVAAAQTRKAAQTLAKGMREHPIAWTAGAAGIAALAGLLISRSGKH